MEHGENYIVFGIVSTVTAFWYAAALLLILQGQTFGWLLGVLSLPLIWGMKHYVKWLFRPSDRRREVWLLISCQVVPTIVFLLAFLAARHA